MPEPITDIRARIAHISDLHFGRVVPQLTEPLLKAIVELHPRVVAVSGDLTMRARERQFSAAADFLKRIPFPKVVAPGNHDIPLWNVIDRFISPLEKYRRNLDPETEPFYRDDDLLVIGVNTARPFAWKGGGISERQIDRLESMFASAPESVFKVVVMHHPIAALDYDETIPRADRSEEAIDVLTRVQADMTLAGHTHYASVRIARNESRNKGRAILSIHAGSALSDRTRKKPNSFNVIDLEQDATIVRLYEWRPERDSFEMASFDRFEGRGRWDRAASKEAIDLRGG